MINYSNEFKRAETNGIVFTRDDNTGYYLNSTIRKRLHVYIYELINGKIFKGHEVHHKDFDKSNNDIVNLICMTGKEHRRLHGKIKMSNPEFLKKFQEKGMESAKEWHKSEDGHKWHKQHYIFTKDALHKTDTFICENCGNEYTAEITGNNRFCSNKCKSSFRRKSGIDNESRICKHCGKTFTANKYSKTKACSKSCAHSKCKVN